MQLLGRWKFHFTAFSDSQEGTQRMIPSTVFYHRTRREVAEDIIANGFRDGTGTYLTGDIYGGVWLSDVPLTADYGISALGNDGDVILRVTLPCTLEDLAGYEWIEELTDPDTGEVWTRRDREWLVLAEMIGAKMRKSVMPAFMSS
jgi:hypothetical protein